MLSVLYDAILRLFHNVIGSRTTVKDDWAVLWHGFHGLYPHPQKTGTRTSHSINIILSSYLLYSRT